MLADYAERWLLTEFVPLDDPKARQLLTTSRRDMEWYSLDGFAAALRGTFTRVETLGTDTGRTLLLCTR